MNGVDLARFDFDYDTTWHGFFLDADLNVYSRYGGRDETSSDGRLSKDSLLTTMREVLAVHERRRERIAIPPRLRGANGVDGAVADIDHHPSPGSPATPHDIPLLKANHQGCVHCHQVREYRLLQSFYDKTFSREDLFDFPLPENVGLRFDRRHGHKIESVAPDSPAAKAGLCAGDVVTRVGDVPIHSEQDVRWALHRLTSLAEPDVIVERSVAGPAPRDAVRVKLPLSGGWRETELGWRKSLRSVPLPMGFLAYDLGREERRSEMLPENVLFIKVVSIRAPGLAAGLGLEKGDLITALEGRQKDRSFEEFKSDLLRRYRPGDRVHITVRRNAKSVDLEGPFPDWHTTDTSVP
jgi:predicted metalloprotease with PDZ domain